MNLKSLTDIEQLKIRVQAILTEYGFDVIAAIAIFILGWWLAKILTRVVRRVTRHAGADDTLTTFLSNLLFMGAMALVVIATLEKLGVNTTSFAAVIAAAGLAVGLALQGSLSNFAAGVMLIFFRPFKAGDFVEAAGISGKVSEVRVFSTVLHTPDNKEITVGNSAILDDNITNYSARTTRRIDLVIGIGYDDDIRKAKAILEGLLEAEERVLADPEWTVAVSELGDSSVNFVVRPWVATDDYWPVRFDLIEKIKLTFDEEGISIPYPQRDVHVFQEQAA